ncbi:DEAD/DEAH box helicase [Streptomyces sp. NPDC059092]|uniref:DEAD/DEAH box helicase n=1 Tax=Streptomyces sp. NPDC059092 TaxID=3346725 RepID=UPI0036CE61BE
MPDVRPRLLSEAGLGHAAFHERSSEGLFPEIRTPYPLQASLQSRLPLAVDAEHGPGVLLVTAPPGEGKTEAALYAAMVMTATYGSSGLFLALPTQATANQMYERVVRFATHNLADPAQLTLLHGAAELYQGYAEPSGRWLRSRGRGLLAPISVGTIGQALLGVLPLKHNALRQTGLSGKTVIIDEAHSYDAFTHALLLRLLTWLGAMRVPVVLLSATLTGQTASGPVEAYLESAGRKGGAYALPAPVHPGRLYADAEQVTVPAEPVGSVRARSPDLAVRPVTHTYDPTVADGRPATLITAPLRTQRHTTLLSRPPSPMPSAPLSMPSAGSMTSRKATDPPFCTPSASSRA